MLLLYAAGSPVSDSTFLFAVLLLLLHLDSFFSGYVYASPCIAVWCTIAMSALGLRVCLKEGSRALALERSAPPSFVESTNQPHPRFSIVRVCLFVCCCCCCVCVHHKIMNHLMDRISVLEIFLQYNGNAVLQGQTLPHPLPLLSLLPDHCLLHTESGSS